MAKHKEMEDFEAQHDLRVLIDAERIRGDKDRLKRAMAHAKEQMKVIKKVEGA